jgi:hypothetical protein
VKIRKNGKAKGRTGENNPSKGETKKRQRKIRADETVVIMYMHGGWRRAWHALWQKKGGRVGHQ